MRPVRNRPWPLRPGHIGASYAPWKTKNQQLAQARPWSPATAFRRVLSRVTAAVFTPAAIYSFFALAALAAVPSFLGCGAGDTKPDPECERDDDCSVELGEGCVSGSCTVVDPLRARLPVAADCNSTGCPANTRCVEYSYDSMPFVGCAVQCNAQTSDECEEGFICRPVSSGPSHGSCVPPCASNGDCQNGRACNKATGLCECDGDEQCSDLSGAWHQAAVCASQLCRLECASNFDCGCGDHCEAGACVAGCQAHADCCGAGRCLSGVCTEATGPLGSQCLQNSECDATLACIGVGYDRGLCGLAISTCDFSELCPVGAVCGPLYSPFDDTVHAVCAPPCSLSGGDECPASARCMMFDFSDEGTCVAPCDPLEGCGAGSRCDEVTELCACTDSAWCKILGANAECDTDTGRCQCTPTCEGRECGPDGCGGQCGTCADDLLCGDDGRCGGACGEAQPLVLCGGGTYCPGNSSCEGTLCTCTPRFKATACDGKPCTNCSADTWHCTPCGLAECGPQCGDCPSGLSCIDGACRVAPPPPCQATSCAGNCVDNCGNTNSQCCQTSCQATSCAGDCVDNCGNTNSQCCSTPTGSSCHVMNCASFTSEFVSGPGHCDGEVIGHFNNNCGDSIQCKWCWASGACDAGTVLPGTATGGELSGILSCGQASASVRFVCAAKSDAFSCVDF